LSTEETGKEALVFFVYVYVYLIHDTRYTLSNLTFKLPVRRENRHCEVNAGSNKNTINFRFKVSSSLVSSTQQSSTSTSTSGPSTSTSTVHKLSALSSIAVAQSKSCGIFHI